MGRPWAAEFFVTDLHGLRYLSRCYAQGRYVEEALGRSLLGHSSPKWVGLSTPGPGRTPEGEFVNHIFGEIRLIIKGGD